MSTATSLPDELDAQALLVRVRELESLLKISDARCSKLEYKLQDLLRRIFGPKNERLNPAQRALFGIPESDVAAAIVPATIPAAAAAVRTRRKKVSVNGEAFFSLARRHRKMRSRFQSSWSERCSRVCDGYDEALRPGES